MRFLKNSWPINEVQSKNKDKYLHIEFQKSSHISALTKIHLFHSSNLEFDVGYLSEVRVAHLAKYAFNQGWIEEMEDSIESSIERFYVIDFWRSRPTLRKLSFVEIQHLIKAYLNPRCFLDYLVEYSEEEIKTTENCDYYMIWEYNEVETLSLTLFGQKQTPEES